MNGHKIEKSQRQVDEIGKPLDKWRHIQRVVKILEGDINRLEQQLKAQRALFCEEYAAWVGVFDAFCEIPFSIPEDHRAATRYRISAVSAIAFESALAAWLSQGMGLPWWTGALLAFLTAGILHGALLLTFRKAEKPRETLGKLRRVLLRPSLFVFFISLVILLLVRSVSGELAVTLLPLFGVSLWTTTIALLIAASTLLAAADVTDWSWKEAKEYEKKTRN